MQVERGQTKQNFLIYFITQLPFIKLERYVGIQQLLCTMIVQTSVLL